MRYYPAFLDLSGKKVIVIGGGSVGERKVSSLLDAGASVTVVAPEVTPGIRRWAVEGRLVLVPRPFEGGDEEGFFLVMVATDDGELNARIADSVGTARCLINVADLPNHSNFIVPSRVVRGDLILAVSTSGASPALSRKLRRELEKEFGEEYAELLRVMRRVRELLKDRVSGEERTRVLYRLIDSDLLDLIRRNETEAVVKRVREIAGIDPFPEKAKK